MLTFLRPDILKEIQFFPSGLLPFVDEKNSEYILVIKANKEVILTAKLNGNFKIYVVTSSLGGNLNNVLVSAFFDDPDEPLTIITPLFLNEPLCNGLKTILGKRHFDLYFFDESNREFFGVRGDNIDFERFSKTLNGLNYLELKNQNIIDFWQETQFQFGTRTAKDDEAAFFIGLNEELYPNDFAIIDAASDFNGTNEDNLISRLERTEPGAMHEFDIALLLKRIFSAESIYLNPIRTDNLRELCDILVLDDDFIIFIQAKDSPNTEKMLRRTNTRKRATILSHIVKAVAQLKGTLNHTKKNNGFTITFNKKEEKIDLNNRQMIGLIIVKEIFPDHYSECSAPVLDLSREQELPIILLEVSALNTLTHHLRSPALFVVQGLYKILKVALENKKFPQVAWVKPPNSFNYV